MSNIKFLLYLIILLAPIHVNAQFGKIAGKVISIKSGEMLIGATISLQGKSRIIKSDQNGQFSFTSLMPGKYTLICTYVSFSPKTIENVIVVANDVTTVDFLLEEAGTLTNIILKSGNSNPRVKETVNAILVAQKNRSSVSDGISQEAIKRTPDRNVGDVLKRVTGASVQEDKFVIVRGLNDGYNASFLNGATLPSSEDNRKAFAFNIFPANTIDNLVIQKTATPDMPGEFAGGLINIETKGIPAKNFQNFSIGLGYNTISTFKERNFYHGGRWDFLGFDNGVRSIPEKFPNETEYKNLTESKIAAASKLFPNYWEVLKGMNIPNISMQYTIGRNYLRKQKEFFGVLFSATYNRSFTNSTGETNGFDINFGNVGQFGLLEQTKRYPIQHQYSAATLFGVLGNVAFKINNNNTINLKNVLSINGEDKVITREGYDDVAGAPDLYSKSSAFWFSSNKIFSSQLIGEHYFPRSKIKLNWLASFTVVNRDMPSLRTMKYRKDGNSDYEAVIGGFTNEGGGNILYFENRESGKNFKTDISRSFKILKKIQNQFKLGFYYHTRDRNFYSRKLNYNRYTANNTQFDLSLLKLPQDKIFDPKNMGVLRNGKGGFFIDDATQPEDAYQGNSELYSYYAMLDQKFGNIVRLIYGARIEDFHLKFYSARLGATEPIRVNSNKQDVLPSANVVFTIGKRQNLRFSYAKTLNRPEFIELAPFLFYDFSTRLLVSGRETNRRASIDNIDVRYEFFPGQSQLFSVSYFNKKFTDPIELRFLNGVSTQAEYVNLPSAEVTGGEAEVRLLLGALTKSSTKSLLNGVTVFGNYTLMTSKLVLTNDPSQLRQQSSRPMQGQSPYVFNAGITYQNEEKGYSGTISFNKTGSRIFITGNGQDGDYDILEAPRSVLDFQIAKALNDGKLEIKFNIRDILAPDRILYYDINVNQKFEKNKDQILTKNNFGRVFSVSLSYKF